MHAPIVGRDARAENTRTLAAAAGLSLEHAEEVLAKRCLITAPATDSRLRSLAEDLEALLCRTVAVATTELGSGEFALELVLGGAPRRSKALAMYIEVSAQQLRIASSPTPGASNGRVHRILIALCACYACAAAMSMLLAKSLAVQPPDPFVVRFEELGLDLSLLDSPVDVGRTYMAGAGAIGNGFLWAARHLDIRGQLDIADDDRVSDGNLNRQVFFNEGDVGLPKAAQLAKRAQHGFATLLLVGRPCRIQDLPERTEGAWLPRLIVAVDSRRARRQLQNEMPGEVFDASTTDYREIVVHYHHAATRDACLSCVYFANEVEYTREQQIADHLGLSLEDVRTERIDVAAASEILNRFPGLTREEVVGEAYDSLFKSLCAQAMLRTSAGRQLLAPFAFVSCLAGTLLALEVVRRLGADVTPADNYWRVSAWHPPLHDRRYLLPRTTSCEFCGNQRLQSINGELWPPMSR